MRFSDPLYPESLTTISRRFFTVLFTVCTASVSIRQLFANCRDSYKENNGYIIRYKPATVTRGREFARRRGRRCCAVRVVDEFLELVWGISGDKLILHFRGERSGFG